MFASKRRPFALTLLISVIIALALVSAVDADSVQRRDHLSLKRIVKKRSPQVGNTPIGAADDPESAAPAPSGSGSASAPVAAPSASSNPSPTSASAQETPSAPVQQPSASANSQPANSPSQPASDTPPPSQNTPSQEPTPTPTPPPSNNAPVQNGGNEGPAVTTKGRSTVVHTETEQASQTAASAENSSNTSSAGKTTLTVFIAIIASVAGATIIWTIFRKWKLARSSRFDARMNPIDWQPSADETRRHSSASSFHSSGHGQSHQSHGYGTNDGNASLPTHDFTAGPAHLAPVGGYADLSRGPSPQPQMQEAFNRGPSPVYGAQPGYGTGRQY